ncbi:MAG: hypothetical protein AAFR88_11265 [Pseudomonadota bacterium]
MNKAVMAALVSVGLALGGCSSTRGGQDVACSDFDRFAVTPRALGYVQDIQRYAPRVSVESDAGVQGEATRSDPLKDLIISDVFGQDPDNFRARQSAGTGTGAEDIVITRLRPQRNILLLSGGGQWGAFGAGLFLGLACKDDKVPTNRNEIPCMVVDPGEDLEDVADDTRTIIADQIDFSRIDEMGIGVITGVSTGGLQSLLLSVVVDRTQPHLTRVAALQQLLASYAPPSEEFLVDRNGFLQVVFTGSVAGTDGLREHVSDVLQGLYRFQDFDEFDQPLPPVERRLIEHIGRSRVAPLVGFVAGTDGEFKIVDMRKMAGDLALDAVLAESLGQASDNEGYDLPTRCVVATTLASAAMPVFHQQLRVMKGNGAAPIPETLFDGGVRRSVFVGNFVDQLNEAYDEVEELAAREGRSPPSFPKFYVVRNGPTTAKPGERIDEVTTAEPQAMRAYTLLVNELEVGSIAALRLYNPYGQIEMTTADGAENHEPSAILDEQGEPIDLNARRACIKKGEEMFNPVFMRCLQNFGARRGLSIESDGDAPIPAFWPLRTIPRPIPEPIQAPEGAVSVADPLEEQPAS